MKVIFYIDSLEPVFLCPFCFNLISGDEGDFENDDYVASNCLIWCQKNCYEMLLCIRGQNTKFTDSYDGIKIVDLDNEDYNFESKCTRKITKDYIEYYFNGLLKKHDDLVLKRRIEEAKKKFIEDGIKFFETGLLKINKIINYMYDDNDSDEFDDKIFENSSQHSCDSGVKGTITYNIPGLLCFTDIEKYSPEIDLSHDGHRLGYCAECTECGQKNISYIWGD